MSEIISREIGWDETIENDGPQYLTLPEGDYDFEVVDFERGRHSGSEKLPACNKAIVTIKIEVPEGVSFIRHNLFLHSITEGMLCAFFAGIGQRKKGEKASMNWGAVPGSKGRCCVGINHWTTKNGKELTNNEIKKFYEPVETAEPAQTQNYVAGSF